MRTYLLVVFLSLLCLGCDSSKKKYTFEEFKTEFSDAFSISEIPIGTYFWDEFGDLEAQYGLNKDESKLLGEWKNVTFTDLSYNYYIFFPNKLFLLKFKFENFRIINAEKEYFNKAVGTWEIINGVVRITIYAIITEDETLEFPNNKGMFFMERPYSFNFIQIEDIDERGFTVRPINNAIMSAEELRRKVRIAKPNRTNNLYVRNLYCIDFLGGGGKDYGYFRIVPEMARENISGYKIATDAGLIKRFIFGLWP